MSGYWNALDRAAGGLEGTARPRPRSRFEPDGDDGDDTGLVSIDEAAEPPGAHELTWRPADMAAQVEPVPRVLVRDVGQEVPEVATTAAPLAHAGGVIANSPTEVRAVPTPIAVVEGVAMPLAMSATAAPAPIEPPRPHPAPVEVFHHSERVVERVSTERVVMTGEEENEVAVATEEPPLAQIVVAEPVSPQRAERQVESVASDGEPDIALRQYDSAPLLIEVGRIEIRLQSETPVVLNKPRQRLADRTAPALADYLAGRQGAAR